MKKITPQTKKQNKAAYYETVKMNNFKESARLEGITVHTANFNHNLGANSKSVLIEKYSKFSISNQK